MPTMLVARNGLQQRRSSLEGRCCRTAACAPREETQQLFGRISDLPPLVLHRIVATLDPASRLELRKVNRLCQHAVDCAWKLVCIPLDQVKKHGMEQLSVQFPAASCLVVSAPQNPVSLSILGRRRRCEHVLSVLLDNTVQQPANLVALDLSHAVSSVTSASLQLLAEALPALHHLALPAVAGVGSSGQWEVLRLLGQLQQLQSCEVDCTYFAVQGRHSGRRQQQQSNLQDQLQQAGAVETVSNQGHMLPPMLQPQQSLIEAQDQHYAVLGLDLDGKQHLVGAVQASPAVQPNTHSTDSSSQANSEALHHHVQQQLVISSDTAMYSTSTALDSNGVSSSTSSMQPAVAQQQEDPEQLPLCQLLPLQPQPCRPWANLRNLSRLQQFQLSRPCYLRDLFDNLRHLRALRSLGLVRVNRGLSSVLLDPGLGLQGGDVECDQGLGQLGCLEQLTRLELGLDPQCSCNSSTGANQLPKLITPPHISTNELHQPSSSNVPSTPSVTATATPGRPASPLAPQVQMAIIMSQALTASSPAAGRAFSHHSCCWSHLTHLRVLSLSGGICLDMPLLAATADCGQLTELRASGLMLESSAPVAFKGLQELRVLTVTQRFDLGVNSAAALFPALERLSIKDDSMQCPDLGCLKHHPSLSSLAIEAPNTGWQLSNLQLGYLVHINTLKQLGLASRCWGPAHGHAGQPYSGTNLCGSPGVGLRSPGAVRTAVSGTVQPSSSSHWLPTATLTQVTSLTLAGPANDHTLSQIPNQFPGLVTLQLLGSYYASDWGLKRLCRAPHLESLLLEGCEHVTEYGLEAILRGGSIKVLAVHGCGGVDERACQRIRRACRHSCANLSWHGTDGLQNLQHLQHHHGKHTSGSSSSVNSSSAASGWATRSIASVDSHHDLSFFDTDGQHCNFGSSNDPSGTASAAAAAGAGTLGTSSSRAFAAHYQCSSGSEFLERCWRDSIAAQQDPVGLGCAAAPRGTSVSGGTSCGSSPASSRRSSAEYASSRSVSCEVNSSEANSNPSKGNSIVSSRSVSCEVAEEYEDPEGAVGTSANRRLGSQQKGTSAVGPTAIHQPQQHRDSENGTKMPSVQPVVTGPLADAATVVSPAATGAGRSAGGTVWAGSNSKPIPASYHAMAVSSSSSNDGRRSSWGCNSSHVATQRTSLSGCAR